MSLPVTVSFHGVNVSPALRETIESRAQKLCTFASDLLGCDCVIGTVAQRRHQNLAWRVHVRVRLAGGELDAERTADVPYFAVNDAFEALDRRLCEFSRRRRGHVKRHSLPA